jgi:GNAT superfamily N-acetyltransferase
VKRLDLIRVADLWEENQEYLKQRLGVSECQAFGACWVLMPTVPYPRFNHVSRIRVEERAVDDLIAEARRFFRAQGLSTSCLMTTPATRPASLGSQLYRLGFTSDANPVMIWDGTPVSRPNAEVSIERTQPTQAPVVFEMIRQVFFPGATAETLSMGYRGLEVSYDLGAFNYLARLKGRPVGAGTLFTRAGMGGIYNMCTLPEWRGRGIARAIMAACLSDAAATGCEYVGLTPTSMGRPLYDMLGFREVYQEQYFVERL